MSKFLDDFLKEQNEKLEKVNKQYADGELQQKEIKLVADGIIKLIATAEKALGPKPAKPAKPSPEGK